MRRDDLAILTLRWLYYLAASVYSVTTPSALAHLGSLTMGGSDVKETAELAISLF